AVRHIDQRPQFVAALVVAHVLYDAHDLAQYVLVAPGADAPSQWAFVREQLAGHALVDDDDWVGALAVLLREVAALQQRDTQRAEHAGADDVPRRRVIRLGRRLGVALSDENTAQVEAPAAHRQRRDGAGRLHARHSAQP